MCNEQYFPAIKMWYLFQYLTKISFWLLKSPDLFDLASRKLERKGKYSFS